MTTLNNVTVGLIEPFTTREKTEVLLCDPCYLFCNDTQDDDWQDFCEIMYPEKLKGKESEFANAGVLYYKGAAIHYMGTAHGDGDYEVFYGGAMRGHSCFVDAGMLCAVTAEDAKKVNLELAEDCLKSKHCVVLEDFLGSIYVNEEEFYMHGTKNLKLETDPEEECNECYECGCDIPEYEELCWSCESEKEEDED